MKPQNILYLNQALFLEYGNVIVDFVMLGNVTLFTVLRNLVVRSGSGIFLKKEKRNLPFFLASVPFVHLVTH